LTMTVSHDELTLVIDIGKSHAKWLMVDAGGTVVERHGRDNASVPSALGYPAAGRCTGSEALDWWRDLARHPPTPRAVAMCMAS